MATKKEDIIKAIEEMSVMELHELVEELKEKFNVSAMAAAPAAAAPAGGAGGGEGGGEEEKSSFDIVLKSAGEKKIPVIKVVREITGLGLKDAKELVDGGDKPVKEGAAKEEADEIKEKLEGAGATVELK